MHNILGLHTTAYYCIVHYGHSRSVRVILIIRIALVRIVLTRVALVYIALVHIALVRVALVHVALVRVALVRVALVRVVLIWVVLTVCIVCVHVRIMSRLLTSVPQVKLVRVDEEAVGIMTVTMTSSTTPSP